MSVLGIVLLASYAGGIFPLNTEAKPLGEILASSQRAMYIIMVNVNQGFGYRYFPTKASNSFDSKMALSNHLSNRTVDIRQASHHVVIVYSELYCSGSLISSRVVVTAATCFCKYRGGAVVKVGADSITGFGQVIPVIEVKIHEYFKHLSSLDNDIAMVVLKDDVVFKNNVAKVLLMEPNMALYDGSLLYVTGYGGHNSTNNNHYSSSLMITEMILVNKFKCEHILGSLMTSSNFCAKYNIERQLDENGGGVLYQNLLVGILSSEVMKKEKNIYAVFTNVSYFHRWLKLNTIRVVKKYCYKKKYGPYSMETNEYT